MYLGGALQAFDRSELLVSNLFDQFLDSSLKHGRHVARGREKGSTKIRWVLQMRLNECSGVIQRELTVT